MTGDTATDSPLKEAVGAAGPQAIEAFATLANETRLAILLVLWEAYEPFAKENGVPFSELRERLGRPDSGQFNYHLDKLVGHFIHKTDGGYELNRGGLQVVQTVIAGTGIEEQTLESTDLDRGTDALASATGSWSSCRRCGAPTEVTYQDRELYLLCTECEGIWEFSDTDPSGVIARGEFQPAGLIDRTPEQAWNAYLIRERHLAQSAIEGVCLVCSGPMDTSLHICEDHASDKLCDNCGQAWAVTQRSRCRICKRETIGPPFWFVVLHPDVIGFFKIPIDPVVTADRRRVARFLYSLHTEVCRVVQPIESPDFNFRWAAKPRFLS